MVCDARSTGLHKHELHACKCTPLAAVRTPGNREPKSCRTQSCPTGQGPLSVLNGGHKSGDAGQISPSTRIRSITRDHPLWESQVLLGTRRRKIALYTKSETAVVFAASGHTGCINAQGTKAYIVAFFAETAIMVPQQLSSLQSTYMYMHQQTQGDHRNANCRLGAECIISFVPRRRQCLSIVRTNSALQGVHKLCALHL